MPVRLDGPERLRTTQAGMPTAAQDPRFTGGAVIDPEDVPLSACRTIQGKLSTQVSS